MGPIKYQDAIPGGPTRAEIMPWAKSSIVEVKDPHPKYLGLGARKKFLREICGKIGLPEPYIRLFTAMAMIENYLMLPTEAINDTRPEAERNFSIFNFSGYMLWKMDCRLPLRDLIKLPPATRSAFTQQLFAQGRLAPPFMHVGRKTPSLLANSRRDHFYDSEPSVAPGGLHAYTAEITMRDTSITYFYDCFNRDDCLPDLIECAFNFLMRPSVGSKRFLAFVRAGANGFMDLETSGFEWKIYMAGVGTALDFIDATARLRESDNLLFNDARVEMPIPHIDGSYPDGTGDRATLRAT